MSAPVSLPDAAGVVPATRTGERPHLLMLITEDWYFWSHRRAIAAAAVAAGYRVTLASRFDRHLDDVRALGVEPLEVKMRRQGRSPVGEALAVLDLASHYRRLRPDIVHHVAIKPVLYGSVAARLAGVRGVVNAISGLGYAFTARDRQARAVRSAALLAYRVALRRRGTFTIFQNPDDRAFFVDRGLVTPGSAVLIRGSGVDLDAFSVQPEPSGDPVVLYAGRMLWSKGVGDLVAAAALLRARGLRLRVVLAGHSDESNPEAIPTAQLDAWTRDGTAEWVGRRDDVAATLAASHVVVLASEREGVPKILLEAAGAGRPLVATDVPGCREVVVDGVNGRLVPVHDPAALADALAPLLTDPGLRARYGAASRAKAEAEFAEPLVVRQTLDLYARVLADRAADRAADGVREARRAIPTAVPS